VPPRDRALLMVPDSAAQRVPLFDEADGTLVDKCFIDGEKDGFERPINAVAVNSEVWISDQNADAVWRYTKHGVFLGVLDEVVDAETGLKKTNGLESPKGMEFVDGYLYVAGPYKVVVFNEAGVNVGFFETKKTQDVLAIHRELYISVNENNEDAVSVYTMDGPNSVFVRHIAESNGVESFDFLQQLTRRQSTNTILGGGFSDPAGIWEFALTGSNPIGNFRPGAKARSAYEVGNGNILWTAGYGVVVLDTSVACCEETGDYVVAEEGLFGELDYQPSVQYIEPITFMSEYPMCNASTCSDEDIAAACPKTCNTCSI